MMVVSLFPKDLNCVDFLYTTPMLESSFQIYEHDPMTKISRYWRYYWLVLEEFQNCLFEKYSLQFPKIFGIP
jgi:hypothetical protein